MEFCIQKDSWTDKTSPHCVAEYGHLQLLKHLISKHNCEPNVVGVNGDTPLHFAAAEGHLDIVKHLTVRDPTLTVSYHTTALHDAARNGHLEIIKFFVETLHCPTNVRESVT